SPSSLHSLFLFFFLLMIPPPPISPLFPYTTLFRSHRFIRRRARRAANLHVRRHEDLKPCSQPLVTAAPSESKFRGARKNSPTATARSAGAMAPSGRTTRSEQFA